MKLLYSIIFFAIVKLTLAQSDSLSKHPNAIQFELNKNKLNKNGMVVLTSWASANLIVGAVGYGTSKNFQEKEFHLMNASWGAINLAISLPGLLSKPKPASSLFQLQKQQTTTEKIFLANAMLDVVYISGGFYLKEMAKNQADIKLQQRFNGFGNSVILQGAGLMVFDAVMTILNNQHRKKHLEPILQKTSLSFSGNSAQIIYSF